MELRNGIEKFIYKIVTDAAVVIFIVHYFFTITLVIADVAKENSHDVS